MTHAYSLSDGTTTFSLTSGVTCVTTGYTMAAPDIDAQELASSGDGGEMGSLRHRNPTDTIELLILGSSGAVVQTNANGINTLLEAAMRRQQTRMGPRVYLQVQLDSDSSVWRSEILYARLELKDGALAVWGNFKIEALLHITRRFFWEGPRTELSISANGQAAATGGRTITNDVNNWVQIASSQVGGVLPTPVELWLTNSSGSSLFYHNFYLACNAFSDPANFTHVLEGEARQSGFGTITVNSGCSSNNYNAYSFVSTGTIPYDLSSSLLQKTQGRSFQILLRAFSWSGTNVYVQPVLLDVYGGFTLAEGDEYKLPSSTSTIINLGSLPLPNGPYYANYVGMVLAFKLRATGSATFNVDYFQLTPLDAYQHIYQAGHTVANGGTITFDNIEGVLHYSGIPLFSPRAGILKVFPGVTQRLFVRQDESGTSDITRSFSARVFIRERRLTI